MVFKLIYWLLAGSRFNSGVSLHMAATIHALLLLLIPVTAIFLCVKYGHLPKDLRGWAGASGRVLLALFGSVVVLYVLSLSCLCGTGNNPSSQKWIPILSVLPIAFLIVAPRLRRLSVSIFIFLGFILSLHFHSLVLNQTACAYTGDAEYISNSCKVPARALKLWHTSITGIYGIEKNVR